MAATVTMRIMEDGPRNAILWVEGNNGATGVTPGSGGLDLAYQSLVLTNQLGYIDEPRRIKAHNLRINKIDWDVQTEFSERVDLFWDATTPVVAYSMIGRASRYFGDFGGLYAPSGIPGATGGIGISTTGSPESYAAFCFTLYLIKLYQE
jgi:hypothetical protein